MEEKKVGTLYVVATPIGNLNDITLRALEVLKSVDLIAAEDTRHTLKLLNYFQISKPLISYYRHNEDIKSEVIINKLKEGQDIALVSDAGTPGICDPGEEVVKRCIEEDIKIVPIPGACAFVNALVCSGLTTKQFTFLGFLPLNKKLRKEKLNFIQKATDTIIIYEAPHKLKTTLNDLSVFLGERQVILARELTKIYEEFIRGNINEIIEKSENIKGEIIIIIEGNKQINNENELNNLSLEEHYKYYEEQGLEKKEIIKMIAKDKGVAKKEIYKYFLS